MTGALILFLAAAVLPVFFGRVQSAPSWLAVQALALGWIALGFGQPGSPSWHALAAGAELLIVRAVVVPRWLRSAIARRDEANRELMPSNLFAWGLAMALLVLAFQFGAPEMSERHALTLGVVGATVAVGLLLLAANDAPPAQLVALLFLENAISLFETLLPNPWPLPVHLALNGIYLLTAGLGARLIGRADAACGSGAASAPSGCSGAGGDEGLRESDS